MVISKVAIITVVFNPAIDELKKNINSYHNQSSLIVVVDNSTNIEIRKAVKNEFSEFSSVVILTLGHNYGIARAQNIGFKFAINRGFEYFIEMDQDSLLPKHYIKNICETYTTLFKKSPMLAGVGPVAVSKLDNIPYHNRDIKKKHIVVEKTLSSGFFSSKEALESIGFKEESLFIDLVDWEWCWRAKSKGYNVFVDTTLQMQHLLGEGHKDFYFFKIGIPKPIRHYYQYRNSLILSTKNYVPTIWKIKRAVIHIIKPIIFLLFFDQKLTRLRYIYHGIKDFVTGRVDVQKKNGDY